MQISGAWRLVVFGLMLALMASACGSDVEREASGAIEATVVLSGLDGPTQMAIDADGFWYVAQLAGGENDETGQVLRIDPADPDGTRSVIIDGLDKPTGIAIFAQSLWVMERNRLVRADLEGGNPRIVVDDMVFNGRSQGSLTLDGDRLLFDTSGRKSVRTESPVDTTTSSGVVWAIDADEIVTPVAWGFKHAYAQTRGPDGTLWTTELADGRYDGKPAVDEVVAVTPGADHGWPRCVGNNRAVVEFEGTAENCAGVPQSQAVFALQATPTGIVVPPWDRSQLLVALWVSGDVVAISNDPGVAPARPAVVYAGAERPQYLLVDGDRVLLLDHAAGTVVALQQS